MIPISYHIRSSIWHGIKRFYHIVAANSVWLIGNGSSINFWKDKWLSKPVVDLIGVPKSMQHNLSSAVSDFICSKSWNLPSDLCSKYPDLVAAISKIVIPLYEEADQLIWEASEIGNCLSEMPTFILSMLVILSIGAKQFGLVVFPHPSHFLFGDCFIIKWQQMIT